jgi:hypothetical protein
MSSDWLTALIDDDLVVRRVSLSERDVVFVKGIFEASEGIGAVFAEPRLEQRRRGTASGGELVIAAPRSRLEEMEQVLRDLEVELVGVEWQRDDVERRPLPLQPDQRIL